MPAIVGYWPGSVCYSVCTDLDEVHVPLLSGFDDDYRLFFADRRHSATCFNTIGMERTRIGNVVWFYVCRTRNNVDFLFETAVSKAKQLRRICTDYVLCDRAIYRTGHRVSS